MDSSTTEPRGSRLPSIGIALGVLLAGFAFWPLQEAGFLADDWYTGAAIEERRSVDPSAAAAVRDAFRHQWTAEFDIFRPLTLLTIMGDYRLFGAHGGWHHLTNLLLWIAFAASTTWLAGLVAGGLGRARRWLLFFFVLLWPAATEAVGWLVAREDLLCGLFTVLAAGSLVSWPKRPVIAFLWLIPAFLAKETAVVAPFILFWTDWCLRTRQDLPRSKVFVRHLPGLVLVIGYLGMRAALFGSPGGTYNGKSYFDIATESDAPMRLFQGVVDSLLRLVAPANESAVSRLADASILPALPYVLGGLLGLVLLASLPRLGSAGFGRLTAAMGWALLPLPLVALPLGGVSEEMDKSRFLVLPTAGLAVLLATCLVRVPAALEKIAIGALLLATVFGAVLWHAHLDAYGEASRRAALVAEDLKTHSSPGERVYLLDIFAPPAEVGAMKPSLNRFEGVHVLAGGIYSAGKPPYVDDRREVLPLKPSEYPVLAEKRPRPTLLRLVEQEGGVPRLSPLAHGASGGRLGATLSPAQGEALALDAMPVFSVSFDGELPAEADRLRFVFQALDGNFARYEERFGSGAIPSELTIRGQSMTVWVNGEETESALDQNVLALLAKQQVALWWVEARSRDALISRTPWVAMPLGQP